VVVSSDDAGAGMPGFKGPVDDGSDQRPSPAYVTQKITK